MNDSELYKKCQEYGRQTLHLRRKFAGLLPEVYKRGLHRRRGHESIYEFAAKPSGMSQRSVDKILNLHKRLSDKPTLRAVFEEGEVGWSKIEKVMPVVNKENEEIWAKRVKTLSLKAISVYVQEFTKNQNIFPMTLESQAEHNSFSTQDWRRLSFAISPAVEKKLNLAKHNLERQKRKTLTLNEVLGIILSGNKEKEQIYLQKCPSCIENKVVNYKKRYIPKDVKRLIYKVRGRTCVFRGCKKAATSLHHTERWSLTKQHDTEQILPLCTDHERLVHSGLIENETDSPEEWNLLKEPNQNHQKFVIDQKVLAYRRE